MGQGRLSPLMMPGATEPGIWIGNEVKAFARATGWKEHLGGIDNGASEDFVQHFSRALVQSPEGIVKQYQSTVMPSSPSTLSALLTEVHGVNYSAPPKSPRSPFAIFAATERVRLINRIHAETKASQHHNLLRRLGVDLPLALAKAWKALPVQKKDVYRRLARMEHQQFMADWKDWKQRAQLSPAPAPAPFHPPALSLSRSSLPEQPICWPLDRRRSDETSRYTDTTSRALLSTWGCHENAWLPNM